MKYDNILKAERLNMRHDPRFEALQTRCNELRAAVMKPHSGPWKFLYPTFWLRQNLYRCYRLALDNSPRKRILDLGCGNGFFVYACNQLGHDAMGLNCEPTYKAEKVAFKEIPEMLGIPLLTKKIVAQKPMEIDGMGGQLDLVTSFMTWFHISDSPWLYDDWLFFLRDIRQYLKTSGSFVLHLNAHAAYGDYMYFDKQTKTLFKDAARYYPTEETFVFSYEKLASL